ncbi:MAG: hypothetical protein WB297_11950, partial [Actinomycetota bacterium]
MFEEIGVKAIPRTKDLYSHQTSALEVQDNIWTDVIFLVRLGPISLSVGPTHSKRSPLRKGLSAMPASSRAKRSSSK